VQKIVAIVGSLLGFVSSILLIFVATQENFVKVTLPGTPACDDDPLGTLGVYTSSYDPECTDPLSSFQQVEAVSSPTTEFFLLFPAQTGFGGIVPGLEDFSSCEDFYNSAVNQASLRGAGAGLLFTSTDATLGLQYGELGNTIGSFKTGVPLGFTSFVSTVFAPGVNSTLEGLQENANGVLGLVGVIHGIFLSLPLSAPGGGSTIGTGYGTPTSSQNLLNGILDIVGQGDGSSGINAAAVDAASGGAISAANAQALAYAVFLHSGASLLTGTEPVDYTSVATIQGSLMSLPFGGVALTSDSGDWESVKSALADINVFQDSLPLSSAVNALYFSEATLNLCNATVLAECDMASGNLYSLDTDAPLSATGARDPLCVAAAADLPFNNTLDGTQLHGATTSECTFLTFLVDGLVAFGDVTPILGSLALPPGLTVDLINEALPTLGAAFSFCANPLTALGLPYSFDECLDNLVRPQVLVDDNALEIAGWVGFLDTLAPGVEQLVPLDQLDQVPENFSDPIYTLCNGLSLQGLSCGATPAVATFSNFVSALGLDEASKDEAEQDVSILALFGAVSACAAGSQNTRAGCIAFLAGNGTGFDAFNVLANALGIDGNLSSAAGIDELVTGCENDAEDIDKFTTAQAIYPVGIAFAMLGAIAGVVGGLTNKTPVAIIAGVTCALGGILVLAALLVVRSAPVYDLVGGDPVEGDPLYEADVGQVIALAAIALAVIGGVAVGASAACNKPDGDETGVSSKVETTY